MPSRRRTVPHGVPIPALTTDLPTTYGDSPDAMGHNVVIGDDLTGALDTGVHFALHGATTCVVRYRPKLFGHVFAGGGDTVDAPAPTNPRACAVTVVDLATRHLPPDVAAARVRDVVLAARNFGGPTGDHGPRFYKKTDSTLRGNIGSELEALLYAAEADIVCFVPAHPELGRTTVNGVHMIGGRPVGSTEFFQDARNPVKLSSVAKIIGQQTSVPTQLISIEQIRAGAYLSPHPQRIVICDADSTEQLQAVQRWLRRQDVHYHPAGCGGFASQVPELWNLCECDEPPGDGSGPAAPALEPLEDTAARGMLVVSGSRHTRSREQVRLAVGSGAFAPRTEQAHGPRFSIINSPAEDTGNPDAVARTLAGRALERLRRAPPAVLGVFGGDTAAAVLDVLEVDMVRPLFELEAGVIVSSIKTPFSSVTRVLVTKAGGFGEPDLLVRIYEHFGELLRRGYR